MPNKGKGGHPVEALLTFSRRAAARLTGPFRGSAPPRSQSAPGALLLATCLCSLVLVCGCGGGGGDTTPTVNLGANGGGSGNTGSTLCLECHFAYPSNYFSGEPFDVRTYADAGQGIGTFYQKGVHSKPNGPQCEDCHGAGGQHYGVGPIPRWDPNYQQCNQCHQDHVTPWLGTSHANQDNQPDTYFGQGGVGNDQAKRNTGALLFKADGKTPVTVSERIQECSVCHEYSLAARPKHIGQMALDPVPMVGCTSCHDSHAPALKDVPQLQTRPNGLDDDKVVRLKPVMVNNNPGQPQYGALNTNTGTWIRPTLWYPFNMTTVLNDPAYALTGNGSQNTTVGDLLRLNSERLCASCHTQGTWKYTAFANTTAYTKTHNQDIFSQYRFSGHGDTTQPAYEEFSLLAALGGTHRPTYPFDVGNVTGTIQGGNNNYACLQCHHGVGTIDYLNAVQGGLTYGDSSNAHVLFGDSSTTCLSCHDPHANQNGTNTTQKQVRIPVYLSYNSWFNTANNPGHGNVRGGLKAMLDGTPIPAAAQGQTSLLCLFCHQGRESGYTLYRNTKSKGFDLYAAPSPLNITNFSYLNAHYFSGGALLWSKNNWEFAGKVYSDGIPGHQQKNCTGCHMPAVTDANITANTVGGHTFKASVAACQACHPGLTDPLTVGTGYAVDGDTNTTTVYQKMGTLNSTVAPTVNDKGLFGQLRWALYQPIGVVSPGIEYDADNYPYFFKRMDPFNRANHVSANANKTWTAAQLQAAFNLGMLYKQGNAVYVHNFYYASQILIDSLNALGVTKNSYSGGTFLRLTTPNNGGTTHTATNYSTIVIP